MPCEGQPKHVRRPVGFFARVRGRVMIEVSGSCSRVGVAKVRQEEVQIPCEVAHMGVQVGVVHLDVGVGHNEEVHSLLQVGDSQGRDRGHTALKWLVVWLEGWVATHKQVGMVAHDSLVDRGRWGEE